MDPDERPAGATSSFLRLTERLSEASVRRRWEAHRDVDWDHPDHQIDADDPRWEVSPSWDPVGASEWYLDQPAHLRSAIGLRRTAGALKVAIEFERVLMEGLLEFAARLPNGHPAFRYAYHEITEEAQHSMMFQELIDRSGVEPPAAVDHVQRLFRRVAEMGGDRPVLFFLAVLSGEEAFDYINRRTLRAPTTHPLLERISRIHVVEESRHVSFARALLRDLVPRLDRRSIRELRYEAGFVVDWAASHMFDLAGALPPELDMPPEVHAAITSSREAETIRKESVANVASLCGELGLIDDRLRTVWSRVGR